MMFYAVLVLCFGSAFGNALRISARQEAPPLLTLPSNATSIREEIYDTFVCEGRDYGYYADVDNGCQVFHVCLPVTFSDGKNTTFRWSFICPEGTVFNQEVFTCTKEEDSIQCEDSPMFYNLNTNFGHRQEDEPLEDEGIEPEQRLPEDDLGKPVQPRLIPLQLRELRRTDRRY